MALLANDWEPDMQTSNLAVRATLFEAFDPLDNELHGQALEQGPLSDMVVTAMEMADCRLASAKILTVDGTELHGNAIETLYWEKLS